MDPGFNKKLMVHVRVRFPDGSEHEFLDSGLWVDDVGVLFPGSVVPVRYDPSNHRKVTIDRPALTERHAPVKAGKQAELEARFERLGANTGAGKAAGGGASPDAP